MNVHVTGMSPDKAAIARLIATGQVLLSSAASRGSSVIDFTPPVELPEVNTPTVTFADMNELCAPVPNEKPKEPWRRGRPLRKR